MNLLRSCTVVLLVLLMSSFALAADDDQLGEARSKWGIRAGLGTDPDQAVGGIHFLETKINDNLYLEPCFELGFGDDHTILTVTAPFHYRFAQSGRIRPYAGGGITVGFVDEEDVDSDLEIGIRLTGGLLFQLQSGQEMFCELNLGSGDLHEAQAMIGWRF